MRLSPEMIEKVRRQERLIRWALMGSRSNRQRLLRDPDFARSVLEEAKQADRHGEAEAAQRLRRFLDVKLVEE